MTPLSMAPQEVFISESSGDTCFAWCGMQIRELTKLKFKADYSDSLEFYYIAQAQEYECTIAALDGTVVVLNKEVDEKGKLITQLVVKDTKNKGKIKRRDTTIKWLTLAVLILVGTHLLK
jgi:hypothetical protein